MGPDMNTVPDRLKQCQDHLKALDPLAQSISYSGMHWRKKFPNDPDFEYIARTYPRALSRKDVAQLAWQARDNLSSIRTLFLASMMWGFGEVGYGPHRTRLMLEHRCAISTLQGSLLLVISGQLTDSYKCLKLPMCGPPFLTKYFYFVGLAWGLDPCPLILDSRVAASLEKLVGADLPNYAKVYQNEKGQLVVRRYAEGYERYVHLIHHWASQLDCRPDSIELFLFKRNGDLN